MSLSRRFPALRSLKRSSSVLFQFLRQFCNRSVGHHNLLKSVAAEPFFNMIKKNIEQDTTMCMRKKLCLKNIMYYLEEQFEGKTMWFVLTWSLVCPLSESIA